MFYIFVSICLFSLANQLVSSHNMQSEYYLSSDEDFKITKSSADNDLITFCNPERKSSLTYLWHSLSLNISLPLVDEIYWGRNASIVRQQYEENNSQWFSMWSLLSKLTTGFTITKKNTILHFETFAENCIGIVAYAPFTANSIFKCELIYAGLTIVGIILFFNARRLSHNMFFYYTCGASVSVLASFLIVILVIHHILPMRRFLYLIIAFGGAVSAFVVSRIFYNLEVILIAYSTYVIVYLLTMGLLGFSFIYWYGPPEDYSRTVVMVRWIIRVVSGLMVFCSIQIPIYAFLIIGLMILISIFNPILAMKLKLNNLRHRLIYGYVYRAFPPRRRFIPCDEYSDIVSQHTQSALAELRDYCQSPKCNSWDIMARLKSPNRLASFVSNGAHISPGENQEYESMLSDNSDSSDPSSFSSIDQENLQSTSNNRFKIDKCFPMRGSTSTPLRSRPSNREYSFDHY